MSLNNLDTMGAIGESVALLGIALLWTYRVQAADWLREFLEIWRGFYEPGRRHISQR